MNTDIKDIMQEMYNFNFQLSILHKILGVDFSRCFEYSHAIKETDPKVGMDILDIGATRVSFFPLFIGSKGAKVTVIDVDQNVHKIKKYAKNKVDAENLNTLLCDATKMNFPDSFYDLVYCISTIEHIDYEGDIMAMEEIGRVLKPGGKAIISVPYGQYEESTWGKWFFRVYDYAALDHRLIKPSKLNLNSVIFHGDSKVRKFSNALYKLPKPFRLSLGWSHILFAKYFYNKDNAGKNDAEMAIIILDK